MNEPAPKEKNCVTKFNDLEHWMETLIYPKEMEYYDYMANNTTESSAESEDTYEYEGIKPKKRKSQKEDDNTSNQCHFKNDTKRCPNRIATGSKQYCNLHYGGKPYSSNDAKPYYGNDAVEDDNTSNQCHFKNDTKRCPNRIATGSQSYCTLHYGGKPYSSNDVKPYYGNDAVEDDYSSNQCHFKNDTKRCPNRIASGDQKYCNLHYGGKPYY